MILGPGHIYAGKIKGDLQLGTDPFRNLPASIILDGRIVTGSVTGSYVSLGSTWTYGEFHEWRVQVTDFTGIGTQFQILYSRLSAATTLSGTFRHAEYVTRNEDGADVTTLSGPIWNTIGKATATVTTIRGGEFKNEYDSGCTITNSYLLQLHFQGLGAKPSSINVGIWFDYDSSAAAAMANFHDIRLAAGPYIFGGSGAANNSNEPWSSAPEGSVYIRSDPSAKNEVIYVKHDTTWTALSD